MKVDLFPTLDDEGAAMAELIRQSLQSLPFDLTVRVVPSTQPFALAKSVLTADAVVLDLTPHSPAHRYTAMAYPWRHDRVLAVSRSYFPLNVSPARTGGGALYPDRLGADDIAAWVATQVRELAAQGKPSLLQRARGAVGMPKGGSSQRPDIFISYRGTDVRAAQALRTALENGEHHDGRRQVVRMFDAGQLAHPDAVLPALIRWNVLAIISDVVAAARETWIVDTPRYLGSWFTQGELICLPYFGKSDRLVAFDPSTGRVTPGPEKYVAELDDAAERRLARYFTNSHPNLMAPESTTVLRALRPTRLALARDEVFADEFWTVPLLQCPHCSTPQPRPAAIDVSGFLTNANPRLYPVDPDVLATCASGRTMLRCTNPDGCPQRFTVRELPPYYLWYGLPVADGSFLGTIPAYAAVPAT
ncbi:hypothetical protein [Microbispora sp. H10836]|uniref:hypothetical protein n=1 Tax=Microbispora sp. H10836 TaxID=2729106 RepID=UPI001474BF44|nr:hypothetical protein [Microbispora sp. H10836]